jgi:hypothetical protein
VALVRIVVSEECIASIIRVKRINKLGMLAVTILKHTAKKYLDSNCSRSHETITLSNAD